MLTQVVDHFGRIDILVNHASVDPEASILEMDEWEFHRTLDVNLGGPFFCMQQVGRVMRERGGGTIVNIASPARKGHAKKGHAAHLASQAGLLGLTHPAAKEFSPYNIRVNTVCTGSFDKDLFSLNSLDTATLHQWLESFPNARLGVHPDLVGLVLFLCSAAASSLTGQTISVELGS
jgi:NAD(P)-dependent dehydrogenase (short-subunit alcohol dehydrogenase family)